MREFPVRNDAPKAETLAPKAFWDNDAAVPKLRIGRKEMDGTGKILAPLAAQHLALIEKYTRVKLGRSAGG